MALKTIAIGIATGVGTALSMDLIHTARAKMRAWDAAQVLTNGRCIINLGAGPHRTSFGRRMAELPLVCLNVDCVPNNMPRYMQMDIDGTPLPFGDKSFGCAVLSHVLEHLHDWQATLSEAVRIADYVVVVLPHPLSPIGRLHPQHLHHFNALDIEEMQQAWPNVTVFY